MGLLIRVQEHILNWNFFCGFMLGTLICIVYRICILQGTLESMGENLKQLNAGTEFNIADFPRNIIYRENATEAKRLGEKIRVLCWIPTTNSDLETKALHVKNTWGKRCSTLLFFTSKTDQRFPSVGLDVQEGRDHLTGKTMKAFYYIYSNHFNDADWFLKADDDTYVVMENLRYMLNEENPHDPVYFGHHFHSFIPSGYHSGGAGYVLSKESLRRFGAHRNNSKTCYQDGGSEDVQMGKCLHKLGIVAKSAYDSKNRTRFHGFNISSHVSGDYPDYYSLYDKRGAILNADNMSDYAISFHYVTPQKMYALEHFLYYLQKVGINTHDKQGLNNPQ